MDIYKEMFGVYMVTAGMIIGSFLNVCIYRIPKRIPLNGNHGRSMCPACGETLKWYDLVPVFSYLALRGKCRFCKEKISFRYAGIELANTGIWLFCTLFFGMSADALLYSLYGSVLLTVSMIDWDIQEIPYRMQIITGLLGVVSVCLTGGSDLKSRVIGSFIISLPMTIITIWGNGFGGGDIQLMFTSGFLLGYRRVIVAMLVGTALCGGYAAIVLWKAHDKKKQIPFGPFLSAGLLFSVFVGREIFQWYLNMF